MFDVLDVDQDQGGRKNEKKRGGKPPGHGSKHADVKVGLCINPQRIHNMLLWKFLICCNNIFVVDDSYEN